MPRVMWPLRKGRPIIEIVLTRAIGGQQITRTVLADTGAGSSHSAFELVLDQNDCLACGAFSTKQVQLHGAFSGKHRVYTLWVQIPLIGFNEEVQVVGLLRVTAGVDGISAFRFLNRFTYGNFGNPNQFGFEI